MTHDRYRELIQRELDGDATPQELQLLEAHTASCDDCRRERDDYSKLAAAFGSLPKMMPERSFVTMMEPELPKVLKKQRRLPAYFWPGLTAAAALVLTVGLSDAFGIFTPKTTVSPDAQPDQVVQPFAVHDNPAPSGPADTLIQQQDAAKHTAPQLIQQETVKEKPAVQVAAVSKNDLGKVKDQTGVVVEQQKVDAATPPSEAARGGVVVVTVDSKPTDVTVDGDNVTVTVAPDEESPDDTSNVSIWGIAGIEEGESGEKTITFTDKDGNVINTTHVTLGPDSGAIPSDSALNRSIANTYKADPEQNAWAKDPYQVVYRHLTDLGFSAEAMVSQSNELSIVTVMQGDATYRVRLIESRQGEWHPVQISRLIHPHTTSKIGQKVIAYFAAQKASGAIFGFGDIYLNERTANKISVSVAVEQQGSDGVINVSEMDYEFQVEQTATGEVRLGDLITVHEE
ncbi:hypothetical protein CBW65_22765 [Tumebacillus avium]|uniref:Anti-sigma-W factor RsiW n=1 Tax=Tumebacillus avium TaxID=1903704 RepID=A0A1Y0IT94_9BACL|nr:zf-HC2 domain-containing protein [Tumebacillus avium]ARU63510.1 hypothetical protein CBW65_22765 [Tumebacillus avium]